MQIWSALLLGLAGSLHCAGMCGPLALALPRTGNSRFSWVLGRLAYNSGRITTYALLGALFGSIGMTLALAGFQRWLSIGAGALVLVGGLGSLRRAARFPGWTALSWLRTRFSQLLQRRTLVSVFSLGVLNGLLPCGLVYVACAASVATGGLVAGVQFMLAFGLGTIPMMLSIGLLGKMVTIGLRLKFQKAIPAGLALMGALLILRGMSLGIPYLSPVMNAHEAHCPACH